MAPKFAYSVLFVRDMQTSIAFYRDVIGLGVKMESPEWTELDTGECTLALHKAAGDPLPPVEQGKIPAGHSHPAFNVEDIDAFAARLKAAGVPCLQEVRTEDFGGRMGVWQDPDGIPISAIAMPK